MKETVRMEDGTVETMIYTVSVWNDENEGAEQDFFDYTDAMNWLRQQQNDYLDACGERLHYRLSWATKEIDDNFTVAADGHIVWTGEDDEATEDEDTPIADALRNAMCLLSTVGAVAWILATLF